MYIHSDPGFEWDPVKAAANRAKHGIDFADAVTALDDPAALTVADPDPDEERFVTIGVDAMGRMLGRGLFLAGCSDPRDLGAPGHGSRATTARG